MRMMNRRSALSFALLSTLAAKELTQGAVAAPTGRIDANVDATLGRLYWRVRGSRRLVGRAAGALVFPTIIKAGFGVGGEYGEGSLLIRGRTAGHYNCVSGSIGFQLGLQARSVVILFMTEEALARFSRTDGWKIGVDGSVALVTLGAGGAIDTNTLNKPVIGFILDEKGLMYNLTLEGSKISRIRR